MKRCMRAGEYAGRQQAPKDPAPSRERLERLIDEELAQSFPASDPPGWVLGAARPPREAADSIPLLPDRPVANGRERVTQE